jgi:hypothetical protein
MTNESPAAVLVSQNGEIVLVGAEGNKYTISVRDDEQMAMLYKILLELKKLNWHLSLMTDTSFSNEDLE